MRRSYLVLLVALALGACGFAVDLAPVDYRYRGREITRISKTNTQSLAVAPVTDRRPVQDPRIITNKMTATGALMTGGYAAERPVAEIVTEALRDDLRQAGVALTPNTAGMTFRALIISYDTELVSGFLSGTFRTRLFVRLELTNSSGQLLWNDLIIGNGSSPAGSSLEWSTSTAAAFRAALDDLVFEAASAPGLRSMLN